MYKHILVYTGIYMYIYGYPILYHDESVHSMLLFMVVHNSFMVQNLRYTEHKQPSQRCELSKREAKTAINLSNAIVYTSIYYSIAHVYRRLCFTLRKPTLSRWLFMLSISQIVHHKRVVYHHKQ